MPNPSSSVGSRRTENGRQCPYCPRTFTKKEHLTRHRRSHTGEKPFHCKTCDRRYSRSDVLARHLQTHPLENLAPPVPPGSSDPPAHFQHTSEHPSLLPGISTFITPAPFPQAESQQVQGLVSADNHATLHSATSEMWNHVRQDGSNEVIQQDISILLPLSEASTENEDASRLQMTASEREGHAAADHASTVRRAEPQFSFQQIMRDQEQLTLRIEEGEIRQQISGQNPCTIPSQRTAVQHDVRLSPLPESLGPGRYDETDPFQIEANFSAYGYLSPGMMDINYLDYATPRTPLPMPRLHDDRSDNTQILLSVERLQQIQRLWRGKRSAPGVRLIRSLWCKVIQHEADNIFSRPTASIPSRLEPTLNGIQTLRWDMNEERRKELIDFCTELDSRIQREGLVNLTPHSTPPQYHSESVFESSTPGFSADGFPTKEALDASVDFFFQYFPMPFVHKATFDAKTTPAPLLFLMCLVGLAALYPESSKPFVLRYQKKLMRFCRSELTLIALGHCQPGEFLLSIASTLLVAYLGLGLWDDEAEERQSHMLCVQMLHIAEKQGLFAAYLGDDLALQLQIAPGNDERSWKTWARVESTKRMIIYLLWIDAAYARLMGSSGVVDMDKVELHLPCQAVLFEATTFPKFLQAAKRGAQLVQTRIQVQNLQATAPPTIDHLSMETLMSALYLQAVAARHGLRGESNIISEAQTCSPAEVLARDLKGENIVASILFLPRKYATVFRSKNMMTSLAWNNLCIALTADLDLLEVASGSDGVASAHTAVVAVAKWSRSANARRAILHAAQVFNILSSSRLHGSTYARPDRLLLVSALVLGMYLFVVEPREEDQNSQAFELLQDIDWAAVDSEGILHPPAESNLSTSRLDYQHPPSLADDAAREFIRHGGPVSFAGEDQLAGATAARKILLNYMHLLDDLGKWRGSRYSQLLRIMSDFIIENNY